MQPGSDARLLREYTELGADAAFTELVRRHTNLVYSAALRQVESPDIASEITQSVFLDLARRAKVLAPRLAGEASLAGWLCRCARNLSLNHRRDDFRRLNRERQAMDQILAAADPEPDWPKLSRVLDAAMSGLEEADYDALVLRFYQNQDFRTIGAAIGVSDDAAQKRVSRALEKLRELLARSGVRTTVAALAVVIPANAIQAAPAGLAAAISTAAISGTAFASAAVAATKTIVMTTLQKTLVAASIAVLAGAGLYEAHRAAQLRDQNHALQQQQAPLTEQIRRLRAERDDATNRLAGLRAENDRLKSDAGQTELLKLRGEIGRLRRRMNPDRTNLSGSESGSTDSPAATNQVSPEDQFILKRTHAVDTTSALLDAFKKYAAANNGQYPENLDQLIASGQFAISNFTGNLGPNDFEIPPPGTTNWHGQTILLELRTPIPHPGSQSAAVMGVIDSDGHISTEIYGVAEK